MDKLDYYRVFYEVAKTNNITKAAENLFISQPAISQTIKKLESDLSAKLFIRNKRGTALTRFGQEVFNKVETAMLALKSIDNISIEEKELLKGSLVIASGSNVAKDILISPIKSFLESFPNIQITLTEGVQEETLTKLKAGEIDLVISQQNHLIKDLPFHSVLKHRYVFIKKKDAKIERFIKMSKGSFTFNLIEEFEKQTNLKTLPEIFVTGYRMAIELAQNGVGIALVPEFLVSKLIEEGKLEIAYKNYQLPTITFGYYFNPASLTSACEVFLKFLEI